MKKKRTLKNGEEVEELDSSVQLIIKTKCPTKWIIEDLETGQKYRANGSIEIGKHADFVILDRDIMTANEKDILNTNIVATYVGGESVYNTKKQYDK